MSDGPYVYQLTERLTYFVVSAELVVSGYMLLNADKLAGFDGAPFLFLTCTSAALAGVVWRYFYNEDHHIAAHGLPASGASPRMQLAVYRLFILLTFAAFVWLIIDGFNYIAASRSVAAAPTVAIVVPGYRPPTWAVIRGGWTSEGVDHAAYHG